MEDFKNVSVYVMTSVVTTKPQDGTGIWVFEYPRAEKEPFTKSGTVQLKKVNRNEANLLTLADVLTKITEPVNLKIYIEDSTTANRINNFLPTWAANGYLTAAGEKIKYAPEWELIHTELSRHPMVVTKGKKSHSFRSWMKTELKRLEVSVSGT